jgi:autonomous glycyl radical cofactor GrcA
LEIDDAIISFFDPGAAMKPVRQLLYFWLLDRSDQASAIRHLAASGIDEDTIIEVSGLDSEQVRRILSETAESVAA